MMPDPWGPAQPGPDPWGSQRPDPDRTEALPALPAPPRRRWDGTLARQRAGQLAPEVGWILAQTVKWVGVMLVALVVFVAAVGGAWLLFLAAVDLLSIWLYGEPVTWSSVLYG